MSLLPTEFLLTTHIKRPDLAPLKSSPFQHILQALYPPFALVRYLVIEPNSKATVLGLAALLLQSNDHRNSFRPKGIFHPFEAFHDELWVFATDAEEGVGKEIHFRVQAVQGFGITIYTFWNVCGSCVATGCDGDGRPVRCAYIFGGLGDVQGDVAVADEELGAAVNRYAITVLDEHLTQDICRWRRFWHLIEILTKWISLA